MLCCVVLCCVVLCCVCVVFWVGLGCAYTTMIIVASLQLNHPTHTTKQFNFIHPLYTQPFTPQSPKHNTTQHSTEEQSSKIIKHNKTQHNTTQHNTTQHNIPNAIEEWMCELDREIKNTITFLINQSLESSDVLKIDWIRRFPLCVVCVVLCVVFVEGVNTTDDVVLYADEVQVQLDYLISQLRNTTQHNTTGENTGENDTTTTQHNTTQQQKSSYYNI